jgi:hypothetical protein
MPTFAIWAEGYNEHIAGVAFEKKLARRSHTISHV